MGAQHAAQLTVNHIRHGPIDFCCQLAGREMTAKLSPANCAQNLVFAGVDHLRCDLRRIGMTRFYIAYLPPQHYDTFRRILYGHLPNTYDEWGQFYVQKAANILNAGDTYREVQIDPDEFAVAVSSGRVEATFQGLDRFAELKAASDAKKGDESI